jgi:hypothetical protein
LCTSELLHLLSRSSLLQAHRLLWNPPEARVNIYEDDYVIGPKYKLREPGAGRGYWRGGVWVGF